MHLSSNALPATPIVDLGNLLPQPLRIFCFLVNLGLKYFLFKTTLKSFHFLLADFNTQGLKDSSALKKAYRKAKLA